MEPNKEIKYLTGIRGVAVLLVLFAHLLPAHTFNKSIAYLGMSLFFTLSGTVLTYIWYDRFNAVKNQSIEFLTTFLSFIWARFARLAPLYLLVAIPYFASSGMPWKNVSPLIPRYLMGMQSWSFSAFESGSIKQLTVYALSWSISSEIFLYLLFPLCAIFFYYCGQLTRWLVVIGAYLIYCATIIYVSKAGIYTGAGYPSSQTWIDWFVYLSPYGRLIEFLFGMMIGLNLLNRNTLVYTHRPSWHGLVAIALIIMLIRYLSLQEADGTPNTTLALLHMGPLFTLPICYLMLALASGRDITERLFSIKPLLAIGTWSYSIYLLQGHGSPLFGQLWGVGTYYDVIKYTTTFVIILLISAGSYQLIETKARRLLLKLSPDKMASLAFSKQFSKIDGATR